MKVEPNLEILAALLIDHGICPEYDRIIGDLNSDQLERLWERFVAQRRGARENDTVSVSHNLAASIYSGDRRLHERWLKA